MPTEQSKSPKQALIITLYYPAIVIPAKLFIGGVDRLSFVPTPGIDWQLAAPSGSTCSGRGQKSGPALRTP